jgi:hypothetical protein
VTSTTLAKNEEFSRQMEALGRRGSASCTYSSGWQRIKSLAERCAGATATGLEPPDPLEITLSGIAYQLRIVGMSCQPASKESPARLHFTCVVESGADLHACEVAFEAGSAVGKLSYKGRSPASDTKFLPGAMTRITGRKSRVAA